MNKEADFKLIYLGACLIAAIRLAREEKLEKSPRIVSKIGESITLAEYLYDRTKEKLLGRS